MSNKKQPIVDDIDALLGDEPDEPTVHDFTKKPAKEKKAKETKAPKLKTGPWVKFENKAGETIIGQADIYYVVRQDGKLHYKEQSSVTLLPEEKTE